MSRIENKSIDIVDYWIAQDVDATRLDRILLPVVCFLVALVVVAFAACMWVTM